MPMMDEADMMNWFIHKPLPSTGGVLYGMYMAWRSLFLLLLADLLQYCYNHVQRGAKKFKHV